MRSSDCKIMSDLNEADASILREKYNNALGDAIITKLLESPDDLRQPLYDELLKRLSVCSLNRANGVY